MKTKMARTVFLILFCVSVGWVSFGEDTPNVLWGGVKHDDWANGRMFLFMYNCYNLELEPFNMHGTDDASGNITWGGPSEPHDNYMYYNYKYPPFGFQKSDEGEWSTSIGGKDFHWRVNVKASDDFRANWPVGIHPQFGIYVNKPMAWFSYISEPENGPTVALWNTCGGRTVYTQQIAFMAFPVSDDPSEITAQPLSGNIYTLRINDFRRWMTTLLPYMKDTPLGGWIIPGSHDSCAGYADVACHGRWVDNSNYWTRTFSNWYSVVAMGQTQAVDIYDQLQMGCRIFDFRPAWGSSDCNDKYTNDHILYVQHTAILGKLQDRFVEVKKFLDDIDSLNHNEVIIIYMENLNNCAGGSKSQPEFWDFEKVLLDSGLDKYVIKNDGRPPFARTVQDLTRDNKHVILMIDNYKNQSSGEPVVFGDDWFPCSPNLDHSYSDGITPNQIGPYNYWYYDQMNREIVPPKLGVLGCEKYFGDSDYVQLQRSDIPDLGCMEASYASLFDYINILKMHSQRFLTTRRSFIVDMYSPAATQLALSLNYYGTKDATTCNAINHPIFSKNIVSVYKSENSNYYFMPANDNNDGMLFHYKAYRETGENVADVTVRWDGRLNFNSLLGSSIPNSLGTITSIDENGVPLTISLESSSSGTSETLTLQGSSYIDNGVLVFLPNEGVKVPYMDPETGKISWPTEQAGNMTEKSP